MSDDIVTRLRQHPFRTHTTLDAADEIERLRAFVRQAGKALEAVGALAEFMQKSEDELIALHHSKCDEQFAKQGNEIERLRALVSDYEKWVSGE